MGLWISKYKLKERLLDVEDLDIGWAIGGALCDTSRGERAWDFDNMKIEGDAAIHQLITVKSPLADGRLFKVGAGRSANGPFFQDVGDSIRHIMLERPDIWKRRRF